MNNNQKDFNIKEIKGKEPTDFSLKKPEKKFRSKKKYLKIGFGLVIVIILIVVGTSFLRDRPSFSKDRIELEILAPTEISSGEEIEFTIKYQNNNRLSLKDARLIIDYPQGAYSMEGNELAQEAIELGDILPEREETKDFKIRLTGERGSIKFLAVRLNYQPENISSRFENFISFKIHISSVLAGLYLTVPQKAISGEEISYILDYINISGEDFFNLKIELNYPLGFSFKSAEPEPSERNNIWQLEELKKDERGTIRVSGILEGPEGENKVLRASITKMENGKVLKYTQTSSITQISSSPLQIFLFVNGEEKDRSLNPGENLRYKIEFKNNSDIALSQLVLKVYFQGEMFDFKTLKLEERGFFDSLNNVITWSAAGISSLALLPSEESGKVRFSLSTKKNFPIDDFNDKNFQISVRAKLETLNVPPQFNLEKLKIEKITTSRFNSKVVLQAKGYYDETTANISNFGPIPPQVNQTTTYTIHWQITNTSNDLENVRVTTVLPQGIEWQDAYTPLKEGAELNYNGRTKQIVWEIDRIPAATGFLIPVYEIVFQIALRPSIIQVGTIPVLIDESELEALDTFTEKTLESFGSAIGTNLPDDLSIGTKESRVVE
jgi:hypothetical protein